MQQSSGGAEGMSAGQTEATRAAVEAGTGRDSWGNNQQEQHNLRRLQIMMQYLLASIAQDRSMTVDEAAELVALTRNAALRMFPGKEIAFNLLCRPRIQRAMRERFHIQ